VTLDDIEAKTEALAGMFVGTPNLPDGDAIWRRLLLRGRQPLKGSDENRLVRLTTVAESLALAAWCAIEDVEAVFVAADQLDVPEDQMAQTNEERIELLGQALHLLTQWLLRAPHEAADAGVSVEVLQEIPRAALLRIRRAQ
jgi:hypothetical protein